MKKILGIVVLGLLWCNTTFAVCTEGDCFNGTGTITYADGAKFVGEFKDGYRTGQGTTTYADGAKYVGEYKYGKKHGKGTYTFADGKKYFVEFIEDKKKGPVVKKYPDGRKYDGEYIGGYKSFGPGVMTYPDGTVKKGFWNGDKFYKTEKQFSNDYRKKHKIKKDIKLRCMLKYVYKYDQKSGGEYPEFDLSIDRRNNQIIVSGISKKVYDVLNITYDEINFNNSKNILANTKIDYKDNKAHMRLLLDKFTGEMDVSSDIDYNNEGITKSLRDKLQNNGYNAQALAHRATCFKKNF